MPRFQDHSQPESVVLDRRPDVADLALDPQLSTEPAAEVASPHRRPVGAEQVEALGEAEGRRVGLPGLGQGVEVEGDRFHSGEVSWASQFMSYHCPPKVLTTVVSEANRSPQPGLPRRQIPARSGS